MMLTSAGQRGDAARCRELGVAALPDETCPPVGIVGGIVGVLGSVRGRNQTVGRCTIHLVKREGKLRILLAEDNAINQQLAVRLLRKARTPGDGRRERTRSPGRSSQRESSTWC